MKIRKDRQFAYLFLISHLVIFGSALFFWIYVKDDQDHAFTLENSSRVLNGILTTTITGMAFVLTLTSQLYTPRLVSTFIKSPFFVFGIALIVFSNLFLMLTNVISNTHPLFEVIFQSTFLLSCLSLAYSIPMLFHITNFLRPGYFLPLLEEQVRTAFKFLEKGTTSRKHYIRIIENWDVITNIAITAIKRDDRQLIRLATRMLDQSLYYLLTKFSDLDSPWREKQAFFIPGLTHAASEYLRAKKHWPEAYLLFKKDQILKSVSQSQNDVISDSCGNIHKSLKIAVKNNLDHLLELHLIFMNSLIRNSIYEKNSELFKILSYHFGVNIEILQEKSTHYQEAFTSWIYYGKSALHHKLDFGFETVLYDSGHILIAIGKKLEQDALNVFESIILSLWKEGIDQKDRIGKIAWKVIVKTFWEAHTTELKQLSKLIKDNFLQDCTHHYMVYKELSEFNSPLDWELTDRLLSVTYLPQEIITEANSYFKKNLEKRA